MFNPFKFFEDTRLITGMIFVSILLIAGLISISKNKKSDKKSKTISTISLVTFCSLVLFLQYYLLTKTTNQTKTVLGGLAFADTLVRR